MAPSATSPNASPDSTGNAGQPVKVVQSAKAPSDIAELSYEQARDELVAIVARLEAGQAPLEESMTLWERGEELVAAGYDRTFDSLDVVPEDERTRIEQLGLDSLFPL